MSVLGKRRKGQIKFIPNKARAGLGKGQTRPKLLPGSKEG